MNEEYRPIDGFPGYYISNRGNVMSIKRKEPILIAQMKSRLGYKIVMLWGDKKLSTLYVARLVLAAFEGYPTEPWLCYAHHKNGDINDCRLENLEWVICETTDEYDPKKSHRKGVLKPKTTHDRMSEAKQKQSKHTIEKAVLSRKKTIELRNLVSVQNSIR